MDTIRINPEHITDVAELTIDRAALVLTGVDQSAVTPDFVGQMYITNAGAVYFAKAITAGTDWVLISN